MFKNFCFSLLEDIKSSFYVKLFFIYSSLTRIVLFYFAFSMEQAPASKFIEVICVGFVNDFVTCIYGLAFLLFLRIVLFYFLRNNIFRLAFGFFSFTFLNAIFLFNFLGEIMFWDEFSTRYNFIAVDYLIYTNEILGTLKESVPVFPIIIALFVILSVITLTFRRCIRERSAEGGRLCLNLLLFSICFSSFALVYYTSEKLMVSKNSFVRELSKNGTYEFVYAFFNNELDYKKFYPLINEAEADAIVRSNIKQEGDEFVGSSGIARRVKGKNILRRNVTHPNYVVIVVESLSAEYLGIFGNKENITPYLDKISNEGILFTRAYATGTRTVRGLEAVVKSLPPTPGSSILRRPNNENLYTVSTVLKPLGYSVDFVFGGYSYFDNMKHFFSNNGFEITDRNDFASHEISFANVWGIADGDAFKKLLQVLDKKHEEKTPFFSLLVTTTNHRPYSFPEGTIDMPQGSRSSVVRYTDFAIEQFIEGARDKPWFNDTIFIIVADHCASSAGKTKLPVNKYHIPIIIYAPDLLEPKKIDYLVSQIDVIPTMLGLGGMEYESKFYGVDALKAKPGRAFIATYQLLGYLKDDGLVILSPNKKPLFEKYLDSDSLVNIKEAISYYLNSYVSFKAEQVK